MLESARASQLHTDKEIQENTELFRSHLQEIDHELTKFPNDPKVPIVMVTDLVAWMT